MWLLFRHSLTVLLTKEITYSGAGTFFRGADNMKYKFRFAPKLLSICINQKCLMGTRLCTSPVIVSKRGYGSAPSAWQFLEFTTKIINF